MLRTDPSVLSEKRLATAGDPYREGSLPVVCPIPSFLARVTHEFEHQLRPVGVTHKSLNSVDQDLRDRLAAAAGTDL